MAVPSRTAAIASMARMVRSSEAMRAPVNTLLRVKRPMTPMIAGSRMAPAMVNGDQARRRMPNHRMTAITSTTLISVSAIICSRYHRRSVSTILTGCHPNRHHPRVESAGGKRGWKGSGPEKECWTRSR